MDIFSIFPSLFCLIQFFLFYPTFVSFSNHFFSNYFFSLSNPQAHFNRISFFEAICEDGSLDSSQIPTLIQISAISAKCYAEARNAFNRSYSQANFIIEGGTDSILNIRKTVRIKGMTPVRKVMRIFGDLIHFLDISFTNIFALDGKEIMEMVSDNCTESLSQLHLKECVGNVLSPLIKPFPNVGIATYWTSFGNALGSSGLSMKLNELFPKLQHLQVKIRNVDDWQMVGDRFPYLRSLNVELPEAVSAQPNIESLFENSPTILSLTIRFSSLKLLKAASIYLNDLSTLQLFDFTVEKYDGDRIQFTNVNSLDIFSSCSDDQIPDRLMFSKLRRLTMHLEFEFTDKWIRFFRNHRGKTVEYFDFYAEALTKKQLLLIAETQPHIRLANIECVKEISADAIIGFIERSSNLFQLQTQMSLIDVRERNMLDEQLHNEWDIKYNYLGQNSVIVITLTR